MVTRILPNWNREIFSWTIALCVMWSACFLSLKNTDYIVGPLLMSVLFVSVFLVAIRTILFLFVVLSIMRAIWRSYR
jgi:hypothetical protein